MPALRGPGLLADDFYLLSHDSVTGEPLLTERVSGLGLAGALLAELAAHHRIDLAGGVVVVIDRSPPPDALARRMLGLVQSEHHLLRDWLEFFARTAVDDVAARLAHLGVLGRRRSRRPWRESRWVPIHANSAALPAATLCTKLIRGEHLGAHDAVLAGLTTATGLDQQVLWEVRTVAPSARHNLDTAVGKLDRCTRTILSQTEAAVGATISSHRA
ncbi:MAG TPA: GPP34 family phosphoprotein [Actinocrinis sp.]|nr:GPP34 family phosphoprotein [Actinocrinis sp.]